MAGVEVQPDGDTVLAADDLDNFGGHSPFLLRLNSSRTLVQTVQQGLSYWLHDVGIADDPVLEMDGAGRPYLFIPDDDGTMRIHRYTADLGVDTGYGGGGVAEIARPGGAEDNGFHDADMSVDSSGVALVYGSFGTFGYPATGPVSDWTGSMVARVSASGALDPTFAGDGTVMLPGPTMSRTSSTSPGAWWASRQVAARPWPRTPRSGSSAPPGFRRPRCRATGASTGPFRRWT